MITTDLLGITDELGTRYRLTALLPMGVLGAFTLALGMADGFAHRPDLALLASRVAGISAAQAVGLFLVLLVFSIVAQPLQRPLVRLLEGYWGASRLAAVAGPRGGRTAAVAARPLGA